jgi:FkbM family methyltransferase
MIKVPRIFIDIGASKGEYTNAVLSRYPDIETYMFEPSKAYKELYKNSFKKMKNIHIEHLALSDKTGKQILYSNNYGSELGSLFKRRLDHFLIDFNKTETIKTIRFDEYWKTTDIYKNNPNSIIDYVKLDIEGNELWALEGFGKIIHNVGIIQFEFGGANIDSRTYFQDFWYFFNNKNKDKDFTIYRISPKGLIQIIKYSESDEFFLTTNYIAVNNKINKLNYYKNVKY